MTETGLLVPLLPARILMIITQREVSDPLWYNYKSSFTGSLGSVQQGSRFAALLISFPGATPTVRGRESAQSP